MRSSAKSTRGRTVLGVFDREEPAARAHLAGVGVDEVIESDRGPDAFVEVLGRAARRRRVAAPTPVTQHAGPARRGTCRRRRRSRGCRTDRDRRAPRARASAAVLVDADDVSPTVAPRLGLPIEPNLRTAIDAVEHGRGDLRASLVAAPGIRCSVLAGLPNANGWAHVRVGEVMRVIEDLGRRTCFGRRGRQWSDRSRMSAANRVAACPRACARSSRRT